jgi:hypothetical protein
VTDDVSVNGGLTIRDIGKGHILYNNYATLYVYILLSMDVRKNGTNIFYINLFTHLLDARIFCEKKSFMTTNVHYVLWYKGTSSGSVVWGTAL